MSSPKEREREREREREKERKERERKRERTRERTRETERERKRERARIAEFPSKKRVFTTKTSKIFRPRCGEQFSEVKKEFAFFLRTSPRVLLFLITKSLGAA